MLLIRCCISAVSLLICFFIIFLAVCLHITKRINLIRQPVLRLMLYITSSTVFRSIMIQLQTISLSDDGFYSPRPRCIAFSYLYHNATFMVLFFTLMASVHLLILIFNKYHLAIEVSFYIALPIFLPFTFTWIPFAYDETILENWCWLPSNKTCSELHLGFIYQWRTLHIFIEFINTCLVIAILCLLRRMHKKMDKENFQLFIKQITPILVYSCLYLALNWFGLIDHLTRIDQSYIYALELIHSITSASQGLVVGVGFILYFSIQVHIFNRHKTKSKNIQVYEKISTSNCSNSSAHKAPLSSTHDDNKLLSSHGSNNEELTSYGTCGNEF